jgi:hypothetical protein
MKMFGAFLTFMISTTVNAGQDDEITTQIDIIENINDPIKIATHNFVQDLSMTLETFSTAKHIDDFTIEYETNAKNTECKCPRKKKMCEMERKQSSGKTGYLARMGPSQDAQPIDAQGQLMILM